jgi:hypothetical protein
MRLMERTGAVAHRALTKIFRQQIAALRDAVYDLSAGKTESGFSKLDAFGATHEVEDNAERLEAIANQHMAAVREGKSSLRITKNFRVGTSRFRNNELCTVTAIDRESITVGDAREAPGPFIWTRVLRSRATRHRAKPLTKSSSACP